MLRTHRSPILNYFKTRKEFSSGIVEGLNNKVEVTMRKSYGFRTFRITEMALYHRLGKLPEPEPTQRFFLRVAKIKKQAKVQQQGREKCLKACGA